MSSAEAFAARLGLSFRDPSLLELALVHSSYLHEHPGRVTAHNERLELLGDSVINLAITEELFKRHPSDDEGTLTARRAAIVSTGGLARLAGRIELGEALMLGEGEAARSGRRRPSLLASGLEALVGAIYLDQGYAAASAWLLALAEDELAPDRPVATLKSPKSRLQELTQGEAAGRPVYRLVDASGPDHARTFRVEVLIEETVVGAGTGPSRREAEAAAAAAALARLEHERGGTGRDEGGR
ncbi:MAG: hypothetical protein RL338_566 [Chloroflexota bacterium]|jgi:ribonuclease-3